MVDDSGIVSDFSSSRLVALSALLLSGVRCNTPPAFRRPKNMDTLIPMFGIINIISCGVNHYQINHQQDVNNEGC